ncbi:metallophosphoesterase [Methylorubrum extorquens]|uniref:Metallophosphoesterase n=1 Tax=Methylorubrum extorquens TaxID=408 RepID=A0AAX3WBA9_METEX|nr:metallophosphoesterase [Methylorubrum extorquens]WHQ68563.1 metallophosphoesterase [Methylorubrum extorquens]
MTKTTISTPSAPVFLTADHHFGHQKVLGMSGRPFASVAEHDEYLIEAWNASVGPKDEVWHLGDFAYRCTAEHAARVFSRLNGVKRLVHGNHEDRGRALPWDSQHEGFVDTKIGDHRVFLCHYAFRAWPGAFRGTLHFYGHTHGLLPDTRQSCDVGVDRWQYRPATFPEILARLEATEALPEEVALGRAQDGQRKARQA